jgi:hypothetical protein
MAGKPIADSGPEPPPESGSGVARAGAAGRDPGERFGPLQVRRIAKDDGRALIAYSRARESEDG